MEYAPIQTRPGSRKEKLKRRIWNFVWTYFYKPTPWFMKKYRIFLLRFFGATIHQSANPNSTARVEYPWNLKMDAFSSLGEGAWLICSDKVQICEYACVGQDVRIIAGTHDISSLNFERVTKPIHIGKGSWLAVSSVVLPGVTIGDYSVIGAGSIVSKNMPEMMICAGNPCKPLKPREFKENE